MATRTIQMRLDDGLVAEVDRVAGPRGRTAFVAAAIRSALSDSGPDPVVDVGRPAPNFRSTHPVPVGRREVSPRFKR